MSERFIRIAAVIALICAIVYLLSWFVNQDSRYQKFMEPKALRSQTKASFLPIALYYNDCGQPPRESSCCDDLLNNPGVPGWNGPYAYNDYDLSPRLRYSIVNGLPILRCYGPDKTFDTDDDIIITMDDVEIPKRTVL
jgi:hypothetical protein